MKCEKFGSHFSCQSLLLGTSVPNDNVCNCSLNIVKVQVLVFSICILFHCATILARKNICRYLCLTEKSIFHGMISYVHVDLEGGGKQQTGICKLATFTIHIRKFS